jgi:serine/threonine-protein kinase
VERKRLEQKDAEAVESARAAVPGLVGSWRFTEALGLLEQTRLGLSEFASSEIRNSLDEVLGDVRLAETLDAIRLEKSELVDGKVPDQADAAARYEAAFKEHGLDCAGANEPELGARIARSIVRDALVGALDEWAHVEREQPRREKLARVARAADPDPWRDSFRDALARLDRARLKDLATTADVKRLSPATIATLGTVLGLSTREAERLFRTAQQQYPADFRINYYLGGILGTRPNDRDRAGQGVSYYRACLVARPEAATVYNNLAIALQNQGDLVGAEAAARRATELHQKSPNVWQTLGKVLAAGEDWVGAERAYRRALELDPVFAAAHRNLGFVLRAQGKPAEAEKSYRRAIDLEPDNVWVHNNLGNLLLAGGKVAEAEKELLLAIKLDSRLAQPHNNLAHALHLRGDDARAEAELRLAIALDATYGEPHSNLGNLLLARGDAAGAEKEFRRALELEPKNPRANFNIVPALVELGRFDEALAQAQVALGLLPPGKPGKPDHEAAKQRLQNCERLLVLERRLSSVLRGDARPTNPAELRDLAEVAARKRRYAVAARFYNELLDTGAPPGVLRYNAACAAALAGCGRGTDDANAAERTRWRQRALEWLRADLEVHRHYLIAGAPKAREQARGILLHWKSDPDLAGVRDPAALATLPTDERKAWQEFWTEVDAALKPLAK